ncbi:MAG TPA: methylmalonyl-CoA mutase family protein [Symbiobacteriaceae bacterium]|nr:methylmalonyl-CoA mutase family protein [Symbiobacteriaceae bacterium]
MRKPAFRTLSGLELKELYTPVDLPREAQIGRPGEFPFTRGLTPQMYRDQLWIMGMYAGYGDAEATNQRFRYLLSQGQTGFSIALDLPTQMGYDPDDPLAEGEVGKVGVNIASLADMERLFDGIPLAQIRQIRTTANAIGPLFAAMVIALARRQGVDPGAIKLFVQNDVLKEYFARGTYIYPPEAGLKHSVDLVEYCARHGLGSWTPLAVSGYHIRDSGSTAVQELAFTFANAVAYIQEALRRGLAVDSFAPSIWAFLAGDIYFLEEVAKFRGARRLWARLLRERFGAESLESQALKIFCYTLGGRATAQQPLNNIARVALMTLAAVFGGVQTIATTAYDEAFATPTAEAATIALRTQQIIAHESGAADLVDGLGGAWALEALTVEIEAAALAELARVERAGGAVACIENGYFSRALGDAAYRYQREIEKGDRIIVGVNQFESAAASKIEPFEPDPESERRQVERVLELRARRDAVAVQAALARLEAVARCGENTMEALIEAVSVYATVGEVCSTLRGVWGAYLDPGLL